MDDFVLLWLEPSESVGFERLEKSIYRLRAISTDNPLEPVLEPFDCFCLVDAVGGADLGLAPPSLRNAFTGSSPAIYVNVVSSVGFGQSLILCDKCNSHAAVKVHSVNTNCRIIFDTQIYVFANSKSEIACF